MLSCHTCPFIPQQAIDQDLIESQRRKLKTGFKLFQLAITPSLKEELGEDASTNDFDKELGKKWGGLSTMERRFYQEQAMKLFEEEEETESVSANGEAGASHEVSEDENSSLSNSSKPVRSVVLVSSFQVEIPENDLNSFDFCQAKETKSENNTEMIGVFKRESCCLICEEVSRTSGDLVKCRGLCLNAFHVHCLPSDVQIEDPDNFKCDECLSGLHKCQICKSSDGQVRKCNDKGCGRFFHSSCLQNSGLWPQASFAEKTFTCPAHMCHTCASDNPKEPLMKYNTRLLRCIRCPTTYHSGDYCVAAGTVQVKES